MSVAHPSICVPYLFASKESPPLHITMKFLMKFYTSLNETPPKNLYAANLSSYRAASDKRGIYVRGVTV